VTIQLSKYQIAETKTFEKIKKKIDKKLYSKIKNFVYPQLRENPFYGTNIIDIELEIIDFFTLSKRISLLLLLLILNTDKKLMINT
jgi:mRNA interferase RelE/StbE